MRPLPSLDTSGVSSGLFRWWAVMQMLLAALQFRAHICPSQLARTPWVCYQENNATLPAKQFGGSSNIGKPRTCLCCHHLRYLETLHELLQARNATLLLIIVHGPQANCDILLRGWSMSARISTTLPLLALAPRCEIGVHLHPESTDTVLETPTLLLDHLTFFFPSVVAWCIGFTFYWHLLGVLDLDPGFLRLSCPFSRDANGEVYASWLLVHFI